MKRYRIAGRARCLAVGIAALMLATLVTSSYEPFNTSVASAAQTAACGSVTPSLTEGPYYKAGSPERTSLLEAGITGTKLVLTGYVYDKNCQPVSHAWIDFWQTDGKGAYDNTGYKMRGHQYTGQAGRYTLETVVPGEYPGRTVHIHVKVQAPNGPVITTQLFMPGVARNNSDGIFNQALLMKVQDTADGKAATFDFVLNVTAAQSPQPTAQPIPAGGSQNGYTFKETGFTVSGDFWTVWLGGRSFEDSLYINGLPITPVRNEVSPTDGKSYPTQWFERARFEYHQENRPPYTVLLGLLGVEIARGRENEPPFKAILDPGRRWYPQTGHTSGDDSEGGQAIMAFWERSGGVSQLGYPISQPFLEVSKDDGKTYPVQYFQRARLEYHPENKGTRYEVLLGRLGAELVK